VHCHLNPEGIIAIESGLLTRQILAETQKARADINHKNTFEVDHLAQLPDRPIPTTARSTPSHQKVGDDHPTDQFAPLLHTTVKTPGEQCIE
jgi:hypothetical protein